MIDAEDPAILEIKAYLEAIAGKLFNKRNRREKMEQTKGFKNNEELNAWLKSEPEHKILRITYHPDGGDLKFFVIYVPGVK